MALLEHLLASVKTNQLALDSSNQLALVGRVQDSALTSNSSSHSKPHLFSEVSNSNSLSSNLLFLEEVPRQGSVKTSQQVLADSKVVHLDNRIIQLKVAFLIKINQLDSQLCLEDRLSSQHQVVVSLGSSSLNKMLQLVDFSEDRPNNKQDLVEEEAYLAIIRTKITHSNLYLEVCLDKITTNSQQQAGGCSVDKLNRIIPNQEEVAFLVKTTQRPQTLVVDFLEVEYQITLRNQEALFLVEHLLHHQQVQAVSSEEVKQLRLKEDCLELVVQPKLTHQPVVASSVLSQLKIQILLVVAYLEAKTIPNSQQQVEVFSVANQQQPHQQVVFLEALSNNHQQVEGYLVGGTLNRLVRQVEVSLVATNNRIQALEAVEVFLETSQPLQILEVVFLAANKTQLKIKDLTLNLELDLISISRITNRLEGLGFLYPTRCKIRCFQTFMTQEIETHWV